MTLNNIIYRIQAFTESHRQIKHFFFGDSIDWLHLGEISYPACFVELLPGTISIQDKITTYNFRAWFCDIEDTASNSQENQTDLQSDLTSIAEDFISMLWYEAKTNSDFEFPQQSFSVNYYSEKLEEMTVAVVVNFSVASKYNANRCQVPATGVSFTSTTAMIISNYIYEVEEAGTTLTLTALRNKSILIMQMGDKTLVPITAQQVIDGYILTPNDYTFDATTGDFVFGAELQPTQILQILNKTI